MLPKIAILSFVLLKIEQDKIWNLKMFVYGKIRIPRILMFYSRGDYI